MFLRHEGFLGALGAFMSYEKHGLDDLMVHQLVERFPMGAPYTGGNIHGPPLADLNEKASLVRTDRSSPEHIDSLETMRLNSSWFVDFVILLAFNFFEDLVFFGAPHFKEERIICTPLMGRLVSSSIHLYRGSEPVLWFSESSLSIF